MLEMIVHDEFGGIIEGDNIFFLEESDSFEVGSLD